MAQQASLSGDKGLLHYLEASLQEHAYPPRCALSEWRTVGRSRVEVKRKATFVRPDKDTAEQPEGGETVTFKTETAFQRPAGLRGNLGWSEGHRSPRGWGHDVPRNWVTA